MAQRTYGMFSPEGGKAVEEMIDEVTALVSQRIEEIQAAGFGEIYDTAVREHVTNVLKSRITSVFMQESFDDGFGKDA